jgi:hypothetical protein
MAHAHTITIEPGTIPDLPGCSQYTCRRCVGTRRRGLSSSQTAVLEILEAVSLIQKLAAATVCDSALSNPDRS